MEKLIKTCEGYSQYLVMDSVYIQAVDALEYLARERVAMLQPWLRHPESFVAVSMGPKRAIVAGSVAE